MHTVIGIGELLWDMLPSGPQLGGAPANFCYHAQTLGAQAYIISCVGDDGSGEDLVNRLEQLGLSSQYVTKSSVHRTGTVSVSIDAGGSPSYVINGNVAWDYILPEPETARMVQRADCICFGTLAQRAQASRDAILYYLEHARKDAIRLFDMNLRLAFYSKELIEQSLTICDILKLNDSELKRLVTLFSLPDSLEHQLAFLVRAFDLRMVALTLGGEGSILYTPEAVSRFPGYPTTVCDTVGAGDAFTAAIALGVLHRIPLHQIHQNASKLASFVCSMPGATPSYKPQTVFGNVSP